MLLIDTDLYIGSGLNRDCYVHPHDDRLCVKVTKEGASNQLHLEEIAFFERMARFRDVVGSPALAGYHGTISTDKGLGLLAELVRDHPSGEVSRTLLSVMQDRRSDLSDGQLDRALAVFRTELLDAAILCKDIGLHNICVQRNGGDIRLRLVDGFGNPKAHPIHERVAALARRQTRRFIRRDGLSSVASIRARWPVLNEGAGASSRP